MHFGDAICPHLDKIIFGVYNWTQYGSIDILCGRAAKHNVRTDKAISLIAEPMR